MATLADRFIEIFKRNLKSDAVPNPPRTSTENGQENKETSSNQQDDNNVNDDEGHEEVIFSEDDFIKDEKKPKFQFPFKSKKNKGDSPKDPKKNKPDKKGNFSSVNTQAAGTVFNVVNSNGVQFGSNHVYYMSSNKNNKKETGTDEEHIEKCNLISLLLESEAEITHKYIDFVAKNLGLNWKSFFQNMGYLKGRIDTLVAENGITEARYQLLHDWSINADEANLGRLATLLWEEGERRLVKELSIMHKENKK